LASESPVFPIFGALADLQRARMLRLLEREELAVGELAAAVQLPQSTMSRHLKALHEARLVDKRAEGTATLYRLRREALSKEARAAWELVVGSLGAHPSFDDDDRRLAEVIASRADPKGFFGRVGGEWSDLRKGLFGERFAVEALLALAPREWTVADLGCGTGEIAAEIAPFVTKVVAIDRERAMLDAARRRLSEHANVEVREGELAALPAQSGEFNACVLSLVLHHVREPARALRGVRETVATDGIVIVIDMVEHDRTEYRTTMGHEHLGFSRATMESLAREAGFLLDAYLPLRPAMDARGPGLFVARLLRAN
jgi:SAM-dependent methyltransferase